MSSSGTKLMLLMCWILHHYYRSTTNWIDDVDQYFKFTSLPMDQESDLAMVLLEDKAKVRWRRLIATKKDDAPSSWEALQEALLDYSIPAGAYVQARGRLANLRQDGAVQKFLEEFQELRMMDMKHSCT